MPALDAQRFSRRLLYPIYLLAVVARAHRLARRAVMDVAEIADEPLLVLKHGFGARAWFDGACSAAGLRPKILLESGAPATLVALAEVGHGVAVIPSNVPTLGRAVHSVLLVQGEEPIGRWSSIVWNPRRFLPPYAEDFVDELVARVRRDFPGREYGRRAPPLRRPSESTE